jgi:hypothetical protein
MKKIRDKMPSRKKGEREVKNKFDLTSVQREMLTELRDVLEMFEFITDEFETNRINISRVYPAVKYLKENLLAKDEMNVTITYQHTDNLRKDLLKSLDKRFDHIINQDIFLLSTFLDPNFGISAFEPNFPKTVKSKIIALTKISEAKQTALNPIENSEVSEKGNILKNKRNDNYKKHKLSEKKTTDKVDLINDYVSVVDEINFNGCPLLFWKANENKFRILSEMARKYLEVPASSAAVERVFSIAGHILSCKRKMSTKLFCHLVFLKLNEMLF